MPGPDKPGADPPAAQGAAESSAQNPLLAALLPVLTVIGTGIGIIGFVIFFGGFILWTRFDAAGLPANEAVAQVPRNDLVVTGASFLVPALLASLAAVVAAVVAWDAVVGNRRRERKKEARAMGIRLATRIEELQAEAARVKTEMKEFRAETAERETAVREAAPGSTGQKSAQDDLEKAESGFQARKDRLEELRENELPEAKKAQAHFLSPDDGDEAGKKREIVLQAVIGGVPMFVAEALIFAAAWNSLTWASRGLLFGVMAATIAVAIVVISATERFSLFAVCVFLGVGVMTAFSTYARTHSHAKVSPLAAVDGSRPVAGFFVAETSDAIYVGMPRPTWVIREGNGHLSFDEHGVALRRLGKSSLVDITIGPIMDEDDAYRRSMSLALALCRRGAAGRATHPCASSSTQAMWRRLRKANEYR